MGKSLICFVVHNDVISVLVFESNKSIHQFLMDSLITFQIIFPLSLNISYSHMKLSNKNCWMLNVDVPSSKEISYNQLRSLFIHAYKVGHKNKSCFYNFSHSNFYCRTLLLD